MLVLGTFQRCFCFGQYLFYFGAVRVEGDGGVEVLEAPHKRFHHVLHLQLLEILAAPGLDGGLVAPPLPVSPLAVQDAGGEGGAENNVRKQRQGRTQAQ